MPPEKDTSSPPSPILPPDPEPGCGSGSGTTPGKGYIGRNLGP